MYPVSTTTSSMKTNLSLIINKAFNITFKNKWLWVFGMLLAGTMSGLNFRGVDGLPDLWDKIDPDKTQSIDRLENNKVPFKGTLPKLPTNLKEQNNVLGASTNRIWNNYYPQLVILGAIGIPVGLIVGLLFIGISYATISWATGSLISGIRSEADGATATLSEMSAKGRLYFSDLLKIDALYVAIILLGVMLSLSGFLITWINSSLIYLTLPLGILMLLAFLIVILLLSLITLIAKINVILDNQNWKVSLNVATKVVKDFTLDIIALVFLNCLISSGIGIVSLIALVIVIAIIGFAAIIGAALPFTLIIMAPLGVVFFIALMLVMTLIAGALKVFNQSTWVLFYQQASSYYKEKQNAV